MKETVLTCGRCGRENRGSHGRPVDNGIDLPGSWEEPGWVYIRPATVLPLGHHGPITYIPVEDLFVCPGCLSDEERIPDERNKTITCGRCGRENRGRLDDGPYDQVTEWDEPGWLEYQAATVERLDGAELIFFAMRHVVGPRCGHVCVGCVTAEERAKVDAMVWEQGEPA